MTFMKKTNIKGCISQEFFPPLPPLQKIKMHIKPILKTLYIHVYEDY